MPVDDDRINLGERLRISARRGGVLASLLAILAGAVAGCSRPAPVTSGTAPPVAATPAPAAGPVRGTLLVRGVALATLRAGSGPPVVFVHGSGGNVDEWIRAVPALSSRFTTLAYSRRFHPPNPLDAPGEYTLAEHVEDLAALLDAAGFESAHVVGSSYGGSVALELARRYPGKVRSLVLAEAAAFALLGGTDEDRALLAAFDTGNAPIRAAFESGDLEKGYGLWFDRVAGQPGAWDALPPERKTRRLRFAGVLRKETLSPRESYLPPVSCEALPQLGPRTVILEGEKTSPLFRATDAALLRCMPGARFAVVPGANHVMHLSSSGEYHRVLGELLAGP